MVELAGPMEEAYREQKQHIKDLIKCYWAHTAKAHKEASAAASILRLLADEVDEQTYVALINAGTRPLIMMEVPQMASQAVEMKIEREHQEKAKNLCNQPIEQIIDKQMCQCQLRDGQLPASCCQCNTWLQWCIISCWLKRILNAT